MHEWRYDTGDTILAIRCMNGETILAIRCMDGDTLHGWRCDTILVRRWCCFRQILLDNNRFNHDFLLKFTIAAFHFILVESIMLWWLQCLTDECSDFSTLFSIAIHWIQLLVWLAVTGWWFCHTVSSLRIFDGLLVLLFPWFIGSNFLTSIRQQNYVSTNVIHCEFFALCT